MKVLKDIQGSNIFTYFDSSNILRGVYDMNQMSLTITFKDGKTYKYKNIPNRIFVQFERAESQGKYLNYHIKPYYDFERLENVEVDEMKKTIEQNKKRS